jgi:hypothetical protein
VFELIWQESREELTSLAPRVSTREAMLKVRHGSKEVDLGPSDNVFTFGRDAQSDIVIGDRMASRQHARIERRRDKFVLIDHSTNGTYCTVQGEKEIELRREELTLRGRGRISFGHAYAEDPAETVEFDTLDAS